MSNRLRNKPQQKQTYQHLTVVYWQLFSLLMELSIDSENCSLTWWRKWQIMAKQVTKKVINLYALPQKEYCMVKFLLLIG